MKQRSYTEPALRWQDVLSRRWSVVIYFIAMIVSVCLLASLGVVSLNPKGLQEQTLEAVYKPASGVKETKLPEWLIPKPLPFPTVTAHPNAQRESFKIPEAEFNLAIKKPKTWTFMALAGDTIRFQDVTHNDEYVSFSAGCFGDCETIESNIAESLSSHVQRDHHRGLDPRVVHWYVHHKTWVEYSVLHRETDGTAWMIGISLKWSPKWLNALKCVYRAPVVFPYESEEVLHLAWDIWAVEFIRFCRNYEVISWD
jgi:hypothetical protein